MGLVDATCFVGRTNLERFPLEVEGFLSGGIERDGFPESRESASRY